MKHSASPFPLAAFILQTLSHLPKGPDDEWERVGELLADDQVDITALSEDRDNIKFPVMALMKSYTEIVEHGRPLKNPSRIKEIFSRMKWKGLLDHVSICFTFPLFEALAEREPLFAEILDNIIMGGDFRGKERKLVSFVQLGSDEDWLGNQFQVPFRIKFLSRQSQWLLGKGEQERALRILDMAIKLSLKYDLSLHDIQENFRHVAEAILLIPNAFIRHRLIQKIMDGLLRKENNFWHRVPAYLPILWLLKERKLPMDTLLPPSCLKKIRKDADYFTQLVMEAGDEDPVNKIRVLALLDELYSLLEEREWEKVRLKEIVERTLNLKEDEPFLELAGGALYSAARRGLHLVQDIAGELEPLVARLGAREKPEERFPSIFWRLRLSNSAYFSEGPGREALMARFKEDYWSTLTFLASWNRFGRDALPVEFWTEFHEIILELYPKRHPLLMSMGDFLREDHPLRDRAQAALKSGLAQADPKGRIPWIQMLAGMDLDFLKFHGLLPRLLGELERLMKEEEKTWEFLDAKNMLENLTWIPFYCGEKDLALHFTEAGYLLSFSEDGFQSDSLALKLAFSGALFQHGEVDRSLGAARKCINETNALSDFPYPGELRNTLMELFPRISPAPLKEETAETLKNLALTSPEGGLELYGFRVRAFKVLAEYYLEAGESLKSHEMMRNYFKHLRGKHARFHLIREVGEMSLFFDKWDRPFLMEELTSLFNSLWEMPFESLSDTHEGMVRLALLLKEAKDGDPMTRLRERFAREVKVLNPFRKYEEEDMAKSILKGLLIMAEEEEAWKCFVSLVERHDEKGEGGVKSYEIAGFIRSFFSIFPQIGWKAAWWRRAKDYLHELEKRKILDSEGVEKGMEALAGALRDLERIENGEEILAFAMELFPFLREGRNSRAIPYYLMKTALTYKDTVEGRKILHELATLVFEKEDFQESLTAMEALGQAGFESEAQWRLRNLMEEIIGIGDPVDVVHGLTELAMSLRVLEWKEERGRVVKKAVDWVKRIEKVSERDKLLCSLCLEIMSTKMLEETRELISGIRDLSQRRLCDMALTQIYCESGMIKEAAEYFPSLIHYPDLEPSKFIAYIKEEREVEWLAKELLAEAVK